MRDERDRERAKEERTLYYLAGVEKKRNLDADVETVVADVGSFSRKRWPKN